MDTDTLSKEEKKPIIVYVHKQLEKLLKKFHVLIHHTLLALVKQNRLLNKQKN